MERYNQLVELVHEMEDDYYSAEDAYKYICNGQLTNAVRCLDVLIDDLQQSADYDEDRNQTLDEMFEEQISLVIELQEMLIKKGE